MLFILVVALLGPPIAIATPATASTTEAATNTWMGPAVGSLVGGVAGAVVCGAGATYVATSPDWKNTENAPFAMIAACLLVVPASLGGAFVGAAASGADEGGAVLGAGLGLGGGLLAAGIVASTVVHAVGVKDPNAAVVVGVAVLAGMTAGPPIGAAIATDK